MDMGREDSRLVSRISPRQPSNANRAAAARSTRRSHRWLAAAQLAIAGYGSGTQLLTVIAGVFALAAAGPSIRRYSTGPGS
jgi:hypothetical protein